MKIFKSIVVASALVLSACGSSEDSATKFMDSGNAYFEEGQYEKARIEYKNALQVDPRLAQPYYKLALISEKEKKWKQMYNNLSVVEQLNPNHVNALVKLSSIYLLGNQFDKAKERLDKALSLEPDNLEAKNLSASLMVKQENYVDAAKLLEEILRAEPDNLTALGMQAMIERKQGNFAEAHKKIDAALEKHPNDVALLIAKLSMYEEQKDFTSMSAIYEKLIAKQPDSWELNLAYTKLLHNILGEKAKAKGVLENFIAQNSLHTKAKLSLLSMIRAENPEQADTTLDGYIAAEPENFELRFAKVASLMTNQQSEQAKSEVLAIIKADPGGESGNKAKVILAQLKASEDDFAKAQQLITEVLNVVPEDTSALLVQAKLDLKNDRIEPAITNLRTVISNSPDIDEAYSLLAQAYKLSGSSELAEDTYREALKQNPYNLEAALNISKVLMQEGDLDRAEEVVVTALVENRNNEYLLELLSQIKISKKEWSAGQASIDALIKLQGETPLSHTLTGQVFQAQGEHNKAIEEFEAGLALNSKSIEALRGLALSYGATKQYEEFSTFLESYTKDNPDISLAKKLLAETYFLQGEEEKGLNFLSSQLEQSPEWLDGHIMLATLHERNNEPELAVDVYKSAITQNPDKLVLKMQLAGLYERQKSFDEARALYEAILEKNNNIDVVANNLASILTDVYGTEADLQRALELVKRFENADQPFFIDTYAWLHVQLNDLTAAKSRLERAVLLAPKVPIFAYHLAMLHKKAGNQAEAEEQFAKAKSVAIEVNDQATLELIEKEMAE